MGCGLFFAIFFLIVAIVGFSSDRVVEGLVWLIMSLVIFGVIGIVKFIQKSNEEAEVRRQREYEYRARQEAEALKRAQCNERMIALCQSSDSHLKSIPIHLNSAERYLDQAEVDYTDSAFAPFWDSIENATISLGCFYGCIKKIEDNLHEYTELAEKIKSSPQNFPVSHQSITTLSKGKIIAERMSSIVRKAQRNFQFSMIYEQRKTNQILVAGFTSLAHALSGMTSTITGAIESLEISIDSLPSELKKRR